MISALRVGRIPIARPVIRPSRTWPARIKFFDHPWVYTQRSAFGTPPDLFGRYSLGLDYSGQPYYEVLNDLNPATTLLAQAEWRYNHLLVNSPYELNLSDLQRRETSSMQYPDATTAFGASLNQNDDAPFSVTDLERVLRVGRRLGHAPQPLVGRGQCLRPD